jgi:hypothetical protein
MVTMNFSYSVCRSPGVVINAERVLQDGKWLIFCSVNQFLASMLPHFVLSIYFIFSSSLLLGLSSILLCQLFPIES